MTTLSFVHKAGSRCHAINLLFVFVCLFYVYLYLYMQHTVCTNRDTASVH